MKPAELLTVFYFIVLCLIGDVTTNGRWIQKEDRFYWISSTSLKWNEARGACERQGGSLVTINDEKEQKFVLRKTQPKDGSRTRVSSHWIGLRGTCTEYTCTFQWTGFGENEVVNENHPLWAEGYPVFASEATQHVTSYVYLGKNEA